MKKLLPAAAAALLVSIFVVAWRTGLISHLSDHEQLVASMRESDVWGPLVCIAIQFVQVIVFFIPGEITQFAAGYVFGAWKGFLLAVTGIMIGSAFAYGCGMLLGRPALAKVFGHEALEKVDHAAHSSRAPTAIFLLFLLPGAPKDAMSYAAGVTGFPLGRFVLISGLGAHAGVTSEHAGRRASVRRGLQLGRADVGDRGGRGLGVLAVSEKGDAVVRRGGGGGRTIAVERDGKDAAWSLAYPGLTPRARGMPPSGLSTLSLRESRFFHVFQSPDGLIVRLE